jgi:hypothetical protein
VARTEREMGGETEVVARAGERAAVAMAMAEMVVVVMVVVVMVVALTRYSRRQ